MLPRERVEAAIAQKAPDVPPLRIYAAPGGLYEHGEKLVNLIKTCGHDFGDFSRLKLPDPPGESDFDEDGRYHAFRTDEWGTTWEFRIFGVWGLPVGFPLNDWGRLDDYKTPDPAPCRGEEFEQERGAIEKAKKRYFTIGRGGSIFEELHSLRRFEDVLMDIVLDVPEIHRLADMLVSYAAANVKRSLALDVDGVAFGDDFGTQSALLLSPETWRAFFKPRYASLFEPIKAAGKKVFFHCCGKIGALLEDFRDVGVDVIWPQLTAFNVPELACQCRDLGFTVELHPDRGDLMQHGTPDEIRNYVYRLIETFRTDSGGSWLYIEIDPGFPWRNVEALFSTAMELRRSV